MGGPFQKPREVKGGSPWLCEPLVQALSALKFLLCTNQSASAVAAFDLNGKCVSWRARVERGNVTEEPNSSMAHAVSAAVKVESGAIQDAAAE